MNRLLMLTALLLSIGTVGAQVASSIGRDDACDAVSDEPLNLASFQAAADAYSNRLSHPEAASEFLLCINKKNHDLAETLMLFQRRLQLPARTTADVEGAFLHYVINRGESKLADDETADLDRLAGSYRESLLLPAEWKAKWWGCSQPETLADLRCVGQDANHDRYGRDDVVPTSLLDFNESHNGYSNLNAVWMAEMSALAYRIPATTDKPNQKLNVDNQLAHWSYKLIASITTTDTDTRAFLAEQGNHQVLSFRGTSGWRNFITDVRIGKVGVDWAQGEIHHGFNSALDSVWLQIEKNLGKPGQRQKQLWVTGHSLGGALAQLAALRLTSLGYRVQAVYTFGTPRVGDEVFVASYDGLLGDRTFPHINNRDVVARVPPDNLGFVATASEQIRLFTGRDHAMKLLTAKLPEVTDSDWQAVADKSIRKTTQFLEPSFQLPSSPSTPLGGPPEPVTYGGADHKEGRLIDHGSFEYLFKLACVALEKDLWATETGRAGAQPE